MAIADKPEQPRVRNRSNPYWFKVRERVIEFSLLCCGLFSILVTVGIVCVLLYNSFLFFCTYDFGRFRPFFPKEQQIASTKSNEKKAAQGGNALSIKQPKKNEKQKQVTERPHSILGMIWEFVSGTKWVAVQGGNTVYGIWPLLIHTLWISLIAGSISLPIGLATATFLSEYAAPRLRAFAKPALEILAGIPTVVYGFFAIMTVTPVLRWFDHKVETFNLLSAGIVVGIMIIPMVASLSEDALRAVPKALRDGAFALGATKFEVSTRVVIPAGLSGIVASFILALSRAIGETMAVAMAAGEGTILRLDPRLDGAAMTGYIVSMATGESEHGSTPFNSLFAVAAALFVLTLGMNVIAQWVTGRYRQVYQ